MAGICGWGLTILFEVTFAIAAIANKQSAKPLYLGQTGNRKKSDTKVETISQSHFYTMRIVPSIYSLKVVLCSIATCSPESIHRKF